jgi:HPt (histidine-containing phosphotransfer) domain-containing protein
MSPEDLKGLSSVIDSKALLARCLNNLDFVERILTLFEDRGAVELTKLDEALMIGDAETVGRIAHRLAGACANAAAFDLQICAANVRKAVNKNSTEETAECVDELHSHWRRFTEVMSSRHKSPASAAT